jgi:hypothetical protein
MFIEGIGECEVSESGSQKIISNNFFRFAWNKLEKRKTSFRFNFGIGTKAKEIERILIEHCS